MVIHLGESLLVRRSGIKGLSGNTLIFITFPTNCTKVTCSDGIKTLSVPGEYLKIGSYCFGVDGGSMFTLYATNGIQEVTKSILTFANEYYRYDLLFDLILYAPGQTSGFTFRSSQPSNSSLQYFTTHMEITGTDNSNYCSAFTSSAIDVTNYSTLSITVKNSTGYSDYWRNAMTAGIVNTPASNPASGQSFVASIGVPFSASNKTINLDITSFMNSYYIGIWLGKYSVLQISSIKLIP